MAFWWYLSAMEALSVVLGICGRAFDCQQIRQWCVLEAEASPIHQWRQISHKSPCGRQLLQLPI